MKCCCEVVECGEWLLFVCVMMSIWGVNGSLYITVEAGALHLATSPSNSEHQQTCHERRGQDSISLFQLHSLTTTGRAANIAI